MCTNYVNCLKFHLFLNLCAARKTCEIVGSYNRKKNSKYICDPQVVKSVNADSMEIVNLLYPLC